MIKLLDILSEMKVNNWAKRKPKIINYLFDEIPQDIAEIAVKRMEKYSSDYDYEENKLKLKKNEPIDLGNMLEWDKWDETPEGLYVWNDVFNGHYQSFYDFHNIKPVNEMKVNNWAKKFKILNGNDKEIPQDIARIAIKRMEEYPIKLYYEENKLKLKNDKPVKLINLFSWFFTPEKGDIWGDVNQGNYQYFYEFHNSDRLKVNEMKVNNPYSIINRFINNRKDSIKTILTGERSGYSLTRDKSTDVKKTYDFLVKNKYTSANPYIFDLDGTIYEIYYGAVRDFLSHEPYIFIQTQ